MSKLNKLVLWFANADANANRRIFRGMLYVGFFVLIGKIVAAGREMVIAYKYGVSELVDVYVFAFVLVTWLPAAWAGVLNTVYVPLIHRMERADRYSFNAQLHVVMLFSAVLVSLLFATLMPQAVRYLATGMSQGAIELLAQLCFQLAPVAGLGLVAGFYAAILLSAEKHSNTLVEAVSPLVVLILVLFWFVDQSILPLMLGTLIGAFLQTIVLYYLLLRSGREPGLQKKIEHTRWVEFRQALGWLALSQLVMTMIIPIDQVIAARLDPGSVSVLSYANRVLALALGLGVTAISRAVLPVLSDTSLDELSRVNIARKWFSWMWFAGVLGLIFGWLLAPHIVELLFERGAFTAQNTESVADAIRYGLWQFPFYFSAIIFVQLFASLGAYNFLIVSSILGFVTKILTGPWLAQQYGVNGIFLSTSIMYAINAVYLYVALRRYRQRLL